jgi:hypothetical protein
LEKGERQLAPSSPRHSCCNASSLIYLKCLAILAGDPHPGNIFAVSDGNIFAVSDGNIFAMSDGNIFAVIEGNFFAMSEVTSLQ